MENSALSAGVGIAPEPKSVKLTISFWFAIALFLLVFLWTALIPAMFMMKPSEIPPLSEAKRISGKVGFSSAGPRRGSYLVITETSGNKEFFSCSTSYGSRHSCLPEKNRGKGADIWWFDASIFPGEVHKFPIQITIAGEWRWTREAMLDRIRSHQRSEWFFVVFEVVVFVLFISVWLIFQRSRHAVDNN